MVSKIYILVQLIIHTLFDGQHSGTRPRFVVGGGYIIIQLDLYILPALKKSRMIGQYSISINDLINFFEYHCKKVQKFGERSPLLLILKKVAKLYHRALHFVGMCV